MEMEAIVKPTDLDVEKMEKMYVGDHSADNKDTLANYYDEVEAVWKMDDFCNGHIFPVTYPSNLRTRYLSTKRPHNVKNESAPTGDAFCADDNTIQVSASFLSIFNCSGPLSPDRSATEGPTTSILLFNNESSLREDSTCSRLEETGCSSSLSFLMIEKEIRRLLGNCTDDLSGDGTYTAWQVLFQRRAAEAPYSIGCDAIDVRRWAIPSCTGVTCLEDYGRITDERSHSSDDSFGLKNSIQNRAFNFKSRKSKVRNMQKTFRRLDSLSEKNVVLPYFKSEIPTEYQWNSQSFDDMGLRMAKRNRAKKRSKQKSIRGLSPSSPNNVCFVSGCHASPVESDECLPVKEEEVDLCYDSDPTDLSVKANRATTPKQKTQKKVKLPKRKDHQKKVEPFTKQDKKLPSSPPISDDSSIFDDLSNEKILSDPALVDWLIEDTINTHRILIWHQNSNCVNKNQKPAHVKALIEMGSILKQKLIYPKFSWRKLNEGYNKQRSSNSFLSEAPHSIELLHICRVLPVDNVDRVYFPFAKRNRCFLVGDLSDAELFEACSTKERDRIVQGLKLTVARLGAMTFFNSEAVFDSFFTPFGSQVPGESPSWFN
jgi:hypothetical protein